MNKIHQRDRLADCLKGYACLLVVFGHVIMGVRHAGVNTPIFSEHLETFIWSFHVPLFMFLSGYVYHITGDWKSQGTRLRFTLHKLLNLGVPYFVFAAVYLAINSITPGVNTQGSFMEILFLWRTPQAQYWFLYALLVLFVLYAVLSGAMKNWQITLTLVLAAYIAPLFKVSFGSFATAFSMALAFGIGASLPSLTIDKLSVFGRFLIIAGHICVAGLTIYLGISELSLISEILMVIGISASIALISLIVKSKPVEGVLLFINRYSFPIYLLHTVFTAGIRIVLLRAGIGNYVIHVIAGMIMGIGIPFIIAWVTDKIPVVDFLFYPSKNIRRLKNKEI